MPAGNINPEECRTVLDDLDVHFETFTEANAELQQKTKPKTKIKVLEDILVNPEISESVTQNSNATDDLIAGIPISNDSL